MNILQASTADHTTEKLASATVGKGETGLIFVPPASPDKAVCLMVSATDKSVKTDLL